jgi:AcrR family transcriptional regulator
MMPKMEDRRVRRTRRLLSDALLALVIEKEYEAITIQEIAERADLNRATFYLHYGSKEELLIESLEAQFDRLVATFAEVSAERPIWEEQSHIALTFAHAAEHSTLYKVILSERGMGYIIHRIINYLADECTRKLCASLPPQQLAGTPATVPVEVVSQHVAGSFYATLAWWLTHDMPYPPEAMAEMVFQLCQMGVKGFFQTIDNPDERAKRGGRELLLEILGKVPDVEPEAYDRL